MQPIREDGEPGGAGRTAQHDRDVFEQRPSSLPRDLGVVVQPLSDQPAAQPPQPHIAGVPQLLRGGFEALDEGGAVKSCA